MAFTAPMPMDFHPATSQYRVDISAAPLATDSVHHAQHLLGQVKEFYNGNIAFNISRYNAAVYTVPADQPLVPITFVDEQKKGYLPDIFKPGGVCAAIPIPENAVASPGTDGALTIYQPATGRVWELWRARKMDTGWGAVWAGRIDNLASTDGYFPGYTGCSATGGILAAGSIGIREAQAGAINHAIGLGITRVAAGPVSFPAKRGDGNSTNADAIHEGRRFRLDPTCDLNLARTKPDWQGKTRPLHPLALMVAKAAQKYGFIITDRSFGVGIACEWGGPTKTLTGADPWDKLRAGTPDWALMDGFPWEAMQALPFDWGKGVALAA